MFAEFAPIWSSAGGHHLTGRPRELMRGAGLWPLEPWAHLLYSRRRMRELLGWLGASTWRAVTIAALPLVLGFALGVAVAEPDPAVAAPGTILFAENWEAYATDEL